MQLRAEIAIQVIAKSFSDNIMPAIDVDNHLAQEQAKLVLALLALLTDRLPLQYRYDLDELTRSLGTARSLCKVVPEPLLSRLTAAVAFGADVCARAGAEPQELADAVTLLRDVTGDVAESAMMTGDGHEAVSAIILAAGKEQLLRERSWLKMQGWEIDLSSVPSIEELLPTGGRK